VILCRNLVFTYFAPALQRRILRGLRARLVPGGFLVVGTHEDPPAGEGAPLEQVAGAPAIYRRPRAPAEARDVRAAQERSAPA
jgi:chemotaxis protein methyltransferase CheR